MTELLREALTEAESLYAVAKQTDVCKASLIRFLRGSQSLRLDIADKLAEHFGVKVRLSKRRRSPAVVTGEARRTRTALHEAGHAWAACVYRRRFKHVTIVPNSAEDSLGHILYEGFRESFDPENNTESPYDVDLIERVVTCSFAGGAGAGLLTDRDFDWTGADEDRRFAIDMLSYVVCEPDELGAYVLRLEYRARNIVQSSKDIVRALAETLLERNTLSYRAAREIMRRAAGPYPSFPVCRALGLKVKL
ncbi:MAG: helix-turn-helix transcriptional regulator [Planctomycetota bacterium]